jgi:hypothetical protein
VADGWSGDAGARDRLAALLPEATDAADALRPSRLPPTQRPASAGRRDRALSATSGTARLILGRTVDLYFADHAEAADLPAAAALVHRSASCAQAAADCLAGKGPVPDTDRVTAALSTFRVARMNTDPTGVDPGRLRLGSLALALGEWTKSMVTAVRIAAGEPVHADTTPPSAQPGQFWYADEPAHRLYWHRLKENLTPRSVYFQGALRLAAALAAARLLAGVLDLSHGFWVLLTILTVLRTSAAETRSALRPALIGTVAGSIAAAVLLVVGIPPPVYAFVLPVVMLVGLAAGPLLGLGWAQALFTLVITLVFAQVTPVDWRLAEARVLDVVIGAAVGVLIGLFAWPRGGLGELHRATGTFLADSARVVRMTVDVIAHGKEPGAPLPRARQDGQVADSTYALYQTEQHPPATLDWQATLVAGHHAVRGAEALIRSCPAGGVLPSVPALDRVAADAAGRYDHVAVGLLTRDREALREELPGPPEMEWPVGLGADLYHVSDLVVWIDGLRDDLSRLFGAPEPSPSSIAPPELRARLARVADGAAG